MAGLALGEAVAIAILQDLVTTYSESFNGLSLEKFDGSRIRIKPDGSVVPDA
jgi:hypothetical protein